VEEERHEGLERDGKSAVALVSWVWKKLRRTRGYLSLRDGFVETSIHVVCVVPVEEEVVLCAAQRRPLQKLE
jgi:hypothetical protein